MNKLSSYCVILFGLVLIALSLIYFTTPARSLPTFLPGFDPMVDKVHFKHGIGALFLALAAFALAWFQTGKKSPDKIDDSKTSES